MYDKPALILCTINYIWTQYQCKINLSKTDRLEKVCLCLKCFGVVAFTLQHEQSPSGLTETMNRHVCSCFIFSRLALYSPHSAFYNCHKKSPVPSPSHLPDVWQSISDRVRNVQVSGLTWRQHAGSSTATRAKAPWAAPPPLSKTTHRLALSWGAVDKTWGLHRSECRGTACEQAAMGHELRRVSWWGTRGQCLRIMDLNMDLRNFIGKSGFFPS